MKEGRLSLKGIENRVLWIILAVFLILSQDCFALSPPQKFQRKDSDSNHYAVVTTLMSLNEGSDDDTTWLEDTISNGKASILNNKIIRIEYGNGVRSYSMLGRYKRWDFFCAGAWFKRAEITEVFNGMEITHVQTYPVIAFFRNYFERILSFKFKLNSEFWMIKLNNLDHRLAMGIMSGNEFLLHSFLANYRHKIHVESSNGRTVYLKLDNPLDGGSTILRFKGVRPKIHSFVMIHDRKSYQKNFEFNESGIFFTRRKVGKSPLGSMMIDDARSEFEMSALSGGDNPLAYGEYRIPTSIGKIGFVVYGMAEDDRRVRFSGSAHWEKDIRTRDMRLLKDEPAYFKELGAKLRSLHDSNIIHNQFHIGNFGVGKNGPIIRDFENAYQMSPSDTIPERAICKFQDVIWPIIQWVACGATGSVRRKYILSFMDGYLGSACEMDLIAELNSFSVYRKALKMDKEGINIPMDFPNLFRALMAIEVSSDNDFLESFSESIDNYRRLMDAMEESI